MSKESRPAVFLDRDGTINEQMGYINHISRFILLLGVAKAIKLLNDNNIPVIVVTNQSGLARGYFPRELLDEVHEKMTTMLSKEGATLDGIYICPHHPEAKEEEYRLDCTCRKPKTGLLEKAAVELNISLKDSYMVGDRWSDLKCADRVGCSSILVLTGYGRGDQKYIGPGQDVQPHCVAENLVDAVNWILEDLSSKGAQ